MKKFIFFLLLTTSLLAFAEPLYDDENYGTLMTHVQRMRDFENLRKSPSNGSDPQTALEKMFSTFWTNGDTSGIRTWARRRCNLGRR